MLRKLGLAVLMSCGGLSTLAAQSTSTPVFLAPYRAFKQVEYGASLTDPGPGFALEGFYRFGHQDYDFGFRAGFQDLDNGPTQFLVGVDFRTHVIDHSEQFPLDGAFTIGAGGAFGNGASQAFIPVGISLGRRVDLEESDVSFVPYLHPVVAPTFGDGPSKLLLGLGLGVDIAFKKRFELRVSGALGDYDGIGLSLAILR